MQSGLALEGFREGAGTEVLRVLGDAGGGLELDGGEREGKKNRPSAMPMYGRRTVDACEAR